MFYIFTIIGFLLFAIIISRLLSYGRKLEKESQQEKSLDDIYKANILRDKLKSNDINVKQLRKRFTRK